MGEERKRPQRQPEASGKAAGKKKFLKNKKKTDPVNSKERTRAFNFPLTARLDTAPPAGAGKGILAA